MTPDARLDVDAHGVRYACALLTKAADALLAALAPVEAVAPPAGKYEPRVGDAVRWATIPHDYVVTRVYPELGGKYDDDGVWLDWYGGTAPWSCVYLRPATPSELAAAGLAVPPPAPTPAPEAKRPAVYSHLRCEPDRWEFLGSLHRWYESSPLLADALLAYDKRKESLKPCPPPVAGSAEKDEAFKALLAYAECEEAAWGCGELEPTLVLHGKKRNEHAHEFLKRLRTKALALSRPVRP